MKIRTRMILIFTLCVGLGFYYLARNLAVDLRRRYLESVEEVLVDQSNMLAALVESDMTENDIDISRFRLAAEKLSERHFVSNIYGFFKDSVDQRVYVTDAHGKVIFDSDRGRDEGKDYTQWRDVNLTLQGFYGARSTRGDPADPNSSVIYVAAPIFLHGKIVGALTIGKPTRSVNIFLQSARSQIFIAAGITAVLVIFLAAAFSFWITKPIGRLTRYARDVRDGKDKRFPKLGGSEIGEMGLAFEEMREALEGKRYVENYIQNLTHELKSPLSAIQGAAELLDEDMPLENRRTFLKNIQTESRRLQQIIEKMLDLTALENQQEPKNIEPLSLERLIRSVAERFHRQIESSGLSLEFHLMPGIVFSGERFLLEQAVANLLDNAIEFSPRGGKITLSLQKDISGEVTISVRDQGPGVPPYAIERAFEKFYSLPRPGSAKKSTGLGLSFVREIAKLHQGFVSLENLPDGGVQATLGFPRK